MDTDHAMPGVSPVKPAMTAGGLCATEATETEATAKRAKNLAVHAPVARFEMKPMRYSRMVLGSLLYASTPVSALEPARGLDQIETIVVIYAENRGFDHLYGLFPGANGLRNVTIQLQSEDHTAVVATWKLMRARIIKHTSGPLNAKGTDVAMEELVLAYERLEMN